MSSYLGHFFLNCLYQHGESIDRLNQSSNLTLHKPQDSEKKDLLDKKQTQNGPKNAKRSVKRT